MEVPMSDKRIVIRVSQSTYATLKAMADLQEITIGEAADKMISTAVGRRLALAKYRKKAATAQG